MNRSPNNQDHSATSMANEIDPIKDGPLANAPDVRQAFGDAHDGKVTEAKQPEENQRTISAAGQTDPAPELFKNAPDVSREFKHAHGNVQAINGPPGGSEMVKDDMPRLNLPANEPERTIVDREHFNKKWEETKASANEAKKEIMEAAELLRELNASGRDLEQSRDMGMGR